MLRSRLFPLLVAALVLASVAPAQAQILTQQPNPSPCGELATGLVTNADGSTTVSTHATPGQRVVDGRWGWCSEAPRISTRPCPAPNVSMARVWTDGGSQCTSAGKYITRGANDVNIDHGSIAVWQQWQGAMRGQLVEACSDGERTVVQATCAPATHCDIAWSTTTEAGKVYTINAAPRASRVPVGRTALARASDGSTLAVQCVDGDFQLVRAARPRR